MLRFRFYFDKDKETDWLNSMAEQGYAMKHFFCGFYSFEPCEPGEWQYQVDIGQGFFHVDKNYADFMGETGVEIVQTWGPWVTLRRKSTEGEFKLYTDVESSIEQYKKIVILFKSMAVLEIFALLLEVFAGLHGNDLGWVFAFLIGAVVIVFVNMVVRTKNTIRELRERRGETPSDKRSTPWSNYLTMGMLLNAVVMCTRDHLPTVPWRCMAVCAIMLMVVGIYQTTKMRRQA